MRGLSDVANTLTFALARAKAAWAALGPRARWASLGAAGIAALTLAFVLFFSGRPCAERADIEARVAALAATNQADAASGKITISQLAERTKKLNAAATAFETSKDPDAFCESLDGLDEAFKRPF